MKRGKRKKRPAPTFEELQAFRNREALYTINELTFPVTITRARWVFQRLDFSITPVGGSGEIWTKESNITFPILQGHARVSRKELEANEDRT